MELQQPDSEADRIRGVFSAMGGSVPLRDVAQRCIASGIWDEIQVESMMINGAIKRVKDALRAEMNGSGLPFAAAIDKGRSPIWRQREFFSYDDYVNVLDMSVAGWRADHAKMRSWQKECRERFGTSPSIPDLVD